MNSIYIFKWSNYSSLYPNRQYFCKQVG